MIRLAHFSDVHITAAPLGWEAQDWLNKRLPGWVNYRWLGRAYRFRAADAVVTALVDELRARRPDRLVFSGDATALGFEAEFARAAELLRVNAPDMPAGLAVPGNHDYYTRASAAAGRFEHYFAPWQAGERIDGANYPFAQRVGPAWLVAVNSCTGNRWAWDASGQVDGPQLVRLGKLLERLEPGPRILVTHYPLCLRGGRRERRTHGLRNLADLIAVAATGGVGLWLHGHRHGAYYLARSGAAPFPVICVGSTTQSGLWSYNEYAIDGRHVRATRRSYAPEQAGFREAESFEVELR
jgi:3',5'-cyclic AMP phosphodiesterase CpdA